MKKLIIFLIFFSLHINLSGQSYSNSPVHELSYRDSANLLSMGIDANNPKYNKIELRQILLLDKRSKINNVIGSVFRVVGFVNVGFGLIFLAAAPSQDGLGQGLSVLLGASFMSVGAIGYGISVPFKGASKRRALERELIIQKLRDKN